MSAPPCSSWGFSPLTKTLKDVMYLLAIERAQAEMSRLISVPDHLLRGGEKR